jgi:hypothetical protein
VCLTTGLGLGRGNGTGCSALAVKLYPYERQGTRFVLSTSGTLKIFIFTYKKIASLFHIVLYTRGIVVFTNHTFVSCRVIYSNYL